MSCGLLFVFLRINGLFFSQNLIQQKNSLNLLKLNRLRYYSLERLSFYAALMPLTFTFIPFLIFILVCKQTIHGRDSVQQ